MRIGKTRLIIIRVAIVIATILLIGIGYEQVMRIKAKKDYPPQGKIININGQNLHVTIKGKKNSLPTVVFEAGYYPTGASSLIWKDIQTEISKTTKTISYDRSGILWSEPANKPLSTESTLENLYHLLKEVDNEGPYILVAHSISGLSARAFAAKYPEMICGLVLVDASHPESWTRIPKEILGNQLPKSQLWTTILSNTGYLRMSNSYRYPSTTKFDSINLISNAFFPERIQTILDEKELKMNWAKKALEQKYFDDLPIKIIGAHGEKLISEFRDRKQGETFNDIWNELQEDMLSLSIETELISAEYSGHYIPLDQPDLVIDVILDLMNQSCQENKHQISNLVDK